MDLYLPQSARFLINQNKYFGRNISWWTSCKHSSYILESILGTNELMLPEKLVPSLWNTWKCWTSSWAWVLTATAFFLLLHLFFITVSILLCSNDGSASPSEAVDWALLYKNDEFKNLLHTSKILQCEMQPFTSPSIGNNTQLWWREYLWRDGSIKENSCERESMRELKRQRKDRTRNSERRE